MIKQPIYAFIALLLLFVVLYFVTNRLIFLHDAKKTAGTVISMSASNDRCGGRRSHYNCTKFSALIAYTVTEVTGSGVAGPYSLRLSAGSVHGWNRPVTDASWKTGQNVPITYSPRRPSEAYEDTFFGVWGTPLMTLFAQLCVFITSLTEPRRRRGWNS